MSLLCRLTGAVGRGAVLTCGSRQPSSLKQLFKLQPEGISGLVTISVLYVLLAFYNLVTKDHVLVSLNFQN